MSHLGVVDQWRANAGWGSAVVARDVWRLASVVMWMGVWNVVGGGRSMLVCVCERVRLRFLDGVVCVSRGPVEGGSVEW